MMPKTASLSDEPFRGCADDAVLGGSASTGRLAPNRALLLCEVVAVDEIDFCAKFQLCSSKGSKVIAFFVSRIKDCLWLFRKRGKNRCCSQMGCPIWPKIW